LNDFDPRLGRDFGVDAETEYFKDPEVDLRIAQKGAWDTGYLSGVIERTRER